MKVTTKFLFLDVFLVVVALAVATVTFLAEIRHSSQAHALREQGQHLKTFWKLVNAKGENIRIVDGKLMFGDYVVNKNNELPDHIRDIFGSTATIFMGDTRVSTNVLMPDGSRALGTRLEGPVHDAIFKQGKPYSGEAMILGVPYLTAYDPIRNGNGDIIGALFVGVKKNDYFATYERLKTKVMGLTVILMLLFSFFAFLLIKLGKKAADALEESEIKYRKLFELQSDAIIMIDRDTGQILETNDSALRLYGYGRKEFSGKKFFHLSDEPDKSRAAIKQGEQHIPLRRHRKKDGTVFMVEILNSYFTWKGRRIFIAAIRDITERIQAEEERKKLESQLLQSQKMEAVGQLAGGIAHDFNNILTAITGYAEIISLRMEQGSPLRHFIGQVLTSAARAAELVQGLLSFSRRQVQKPKPVDLCEIVRGLKDMLGRIIREDIDFRTSVSCRPLAVLAAKGQVEQMLMNFVTNAKDSMPYGGILSIDVAPFVMDTEFVKSHGFGIPGNYACITVADTGCGMDEETRKRIFEPFYTTKEVGKGTGLGMFIIYGIVQQHNGFIYLNSEPGNGTVFRVYLPLTTVESVDAPDADAARPTLGGPETILLVEDDATVRELHRLILEDAGYTVIEAIDGEDGLAKFGEHWSKIDLLATDVVMPKLDGKRLHQEIERVRPGMKVLFMSGYTKDIVIDRGILDVQSNYIAKPVTSSELLLKVRNILDQGGYFAAGNDQAGLR